MPIRSSLIDLVGDTPLLRLRRLSDETGCEILAKCEFLNPGGSIKDRAALAIIEDAEARGVLRPGGVIVEGTAGTSMRSAPQERIMSFFSRLCVSGMTMTVR